MDSVRSHVLVGSVAQVKSKLVKKRRAPGEIKSSQTMRLTGRVQSCLKNSRRRKPTQFPTTKLEKEK